MEQESLHLELPTKKAMLSIIALFIATLSVSIQLRNDVMEEEHFFKFNRFRTTEQFTCTLDPISYLNRYVIVRLKPIPHNAKKANPILITSSLHIRGEDFFGESTIKHFEGKTDLVTIYEESDFPTCAISINILCEGKLKQYEGFRLYLTTGSDKNSLFLIWINTAFMFAAILCFYLYNENAADMINSVFSVNPLNMIRVIFIVTIVANIPEIWVNKMHSMGFLRYAVLRSRSLLDALLLIFPFFVVASNSQKMRVLVPIIIGIVVYVFADGSETLNNKMLTGIRHVVLLVFMGVSIWVQRCTGKQTETAVKRLTMIIIISQIIRLFYAPTILTTLYKEVVNNAIVFLIGLMASSSLQSTSLVVAQDLGLETVE